MLFWYILGGIVVLALIGRLIEWFEEANKAAAERMEIEEDDHVIQEVLNDFDIQKERTEIEELVKQGNTQIRGGS
jgi:hypothetical protein